MVCLADITKGIREVGTRASDPLQRIAAMETLLEQTSAHERSAAVLNEDGIKAALDRGDLRIANQLSPLDSESIAARYLRDLYPILNSERFLNLNFDLVAPALELALNGDRAGREAYESLRAFTEGFFERGLGLEIARQTNHAYGQVRMPEGPDLDGQIKASQRVPLTFRTSCALTYRGTRDYLDLCATVASTYAVERGAEQEWLKQERAGVVLPISPSIVGEAGRKLGDALTTRGFAAQILADVRALTGLPLDDREIVRISLSVLHSPWEALEHSLTKRAIAASTAIAAHPELERHIGALKVANDPARKAEQILDALAASRARSNVEQTADLAHRDGSPRHIDSSDPLGDLRASLTSGFESGIQSYRPNEEEPRRLARQLTSLVLKGLATYPGVIETLSNSEASVQQIIYDLRITERAKYATAPRFAASAESLDQCDPRVELESTDSTNSLSVPDRIRAEIDRLDHRLRRAVNARLERFESGNWGNWAPIGHGLIELKIYIGPGLRAYLKPLGEREFQVVGFGDKGSQQSDIDRLVN